MKLSELVNLKNHLDNMSSELIQSTAQHELNKIVDYLNNNLPSDELSSDYHTISEAFTNFELTLDKIKQDVKEQIEVAEKPWFQESYTLYEGELISPAETILELRATKNIDNYELFKSRLKLYSDWRYSALIIRPGNDSFIEDMVAFDPLYLVDIDHGYLTPSIARFNEQYSERLCTYVIKEDLDHELLDKIPNNQFGLCLAYNYFNFRPFEIIKKYLAEVYTKLKPGGTFIITFNDCDRASAVRLVESYYSCYTPGYLVRELVQTMGYEITYSWNDHGPITWLELKKPGYLTSIKGGQSLAKILPKPL